MRFPWPPELWHWLTLGLALIAIEVLIAPGSFLLWIGLAALLTGVLRFFIDLPWQAEFVAFAALSIVALMIGRHFWKQGRDQTDEMKLNDRNAQLIGQVFPLDQAIKNGFGRVRINDTVWRVSGSDLGAGAKVRVASVEGATLQVVPAA